MTPAPAEEEGWAGTLATALVSSLPLPALVAQRLQQAFTPDAEAGTSTLRFVLAQGSPDDGLETFPLIENGAVNTGPMASTPFYPREQPSAVQRCLQRHALVRIDTGTPDREQLADWRQLRAQCGVDWLLAAPLACTPARQHGSRLLGAVLVAGRGGAPSVDERWLEEWAGEMASNIYHASVQLMECSLEMLGVLFPPRVLEQLVTNAAKKTGQVDLAEVLRTSAPPSYSSAGSGRRAGGGMTPSTAPSSLRSSLEGVGEAQHSGSLSGMPRSSPPPPGERALQTQQAQQGQQVVPPHVWGISASSASQSAHVSPFAEAAAAAAASGAMSPVPPGSLSPVGGLHLSASRGGSVASAVLRQASLQSALSRMLTEQEASPVSPHEWEVTGFEDILMEDKNAAVARRPSMALERAHSRPTPTLDQSIAAATAAVESAGGLPAAVQDAQAHTATEQAAATAGAASDGMDGPAAPGQQQLLFDKSSADKSGGTTAAAALAATTPQQAARAPPPAVRVPWAKKPLSNPLGSGELKQQDPLSSPRQPPAMPSCLGERAGSGPSAAPPAAAAAPAPASAQAGGSSGKAASGKAASGSRAASGGISAGSGSLKSGSLPSSASAGSGALAGRGGSAGGTAGAAGDKLSPAAAAAARQRLDLSFAAPLLEAHYKRWAAPFTLRTDAALGVLHALEGCLVAARLVTEGLSVPALVALAVSAVMVAAAVPSWRRSGWWAAHRTPALAAVRLLLALLVAAQVALSTSPSVHDGSSASTVLSLLGDNGASALFWLPFRFSLPFTVHLPVHLLCLWVVTAGATLAHVRGAGCPTAAACPAALPITAVIAAQLVVGFLLASLLAYQAEAGRRRRFLHTSHRAAAFLRRQALPPTSPPAAGVPPGKPTPA
ncbi:hypothetical protein C2E21_4280 [Chlorella sorokiniana]|uniref:Uncharacterized protein n=1 Tax=Chlorella sorokiniana TaxID=3076 RepID=A0A2P6TSP5_CHLSO|nr:hypothetical protein C2E21_4280 [Chlorella sorokiniana]|eukprot:PRW57073.1 hypothetical protein C2E21_4280 [Chlorella sorokiniana]